MSVQDDRKKGSRTRLIKRYFYSILFFIVLLFLINGMAYSLLLNNSLWRYFSGYIEFMKLIVPSLLVLSYYLVIYFKAKDLEDELLSQSGKIKKDTEMLKRVSERGHM